MALLLEKCNAAIFEIPKTGTTWMRSVLDKFGIRYKLLSPIINACPRHSPWDRYTNNIHDFDFRIVSIRYPPSWISSYWRKHSEGKIPWVEGREYLHRELGDTMPSSFPDFVNYIIENQTGIVGRIFEQFTGTRQEPYYTHLIKQESLASDFWSVLNQLGYDVPFLHNGVADHPRQNQTETKKKWDPALFYRFADSEHHIISRFYREFSPDYIGGEYWYE